LLSSCAKTILLMVAPVLVPVPSATPLLGP
jgi:hypothetical protein